MTLRLLRLFVCLFLVLVIAPRMALAWVVDSSPLNTVSAHSDGSPCHDGTDEDAPCDDGCSCVCCATMRVAPPPFETLGAISYGAVLVLGVSEPPDLHPVQPNLRLYRPPKA